MGGVRSLSRLAGPRGSLKDVGGAAAGDDLPKLISLICQGGISGQGVNIGGGSTWGATVALTDTIKAGDVMVALCQTDSWFGPQGNPNTYGETAIHPDDGWDLLAESTSSPRYTLWSKTATGLETSVRVGAIRSGGVHIVVLRGYEMPTLDDLLTKSDFLPAPSGTDFQLHPLSDQTYDAVIMLGSGDRYDYMGITTRYQDSPAYLTQLGGGSGTTTSSYSWAGGLYAMPEAAGYVMAVGGDLGGDKLWRFGLRVAA